MRSEIKLKVALNFALVDALSPWLLVIFYITGIDIVWLVNVNFALFFCFLFFNIRYKQPSFYLFSIFALALLISIFKLVLAFYMSRDIDFSHAISYCYGLVMPLVVLSFSTRILDLDSQISSNLLKTFAKRYLILSAPGVLVYSFLYFQGRIEYFGLGVNLHYIYPFFLTGKVAPVAGFLLLILMSGKRSVLLNFLFQTVLYNVGNIKANTLKSVFFLVVLCSSIFAVYTKTTLLDRFSWLFDGSFDFDDPYFLLVSGGGRFEELFGILDYFNNFTYEIFFGSPPGAFYTWSMDWSGYDATKNYAHVTIFGYIFRYGIVFAVLFYFYLFRILFLHLGSRNPLYIVFGGVVSSSFFGANLIIDPTSWLFIGFLLSKLKGSSSK